MKLFGEGGSFIFNNSGGVPLAIAMLIVGLILVLLLQKRRRSHISAIGLAAKALALAALALVVLEPRVIRRSHRASITALVDISESMDEVVAEDLLDRLAPFSSQELVLIPFSGRSGAAWPHGESYQKLRQAWGTLDTGNTNIEKALQSAFSSEQAHVVLISDGRQTSGDAAKALTSPGVRPIYPLIPESAEPQEGSFRISGVYAPLMTQLRRSIDVRVSVKNTTHTLQRGRVVVKHADKIILEREVEISAGRETAFVAKSDPSAEGIQEIRAELHPANSNLLPSSEITYLAVQAGERVLLVSGNEADRRYLDQVLKRQGYQLVSHTASAAQPFDLSDLTRYAVVVFNNVAMNELRGAGGEQISRYVHSGGGFVMIGGAKSFGLGGYINTPIASLLPVEPLPPRTEQKRLTVAVQLLIDKSGSMAFHKRMDFAREAAKEVVRNLQHDDYIGIVGFDSSPFLVVRLAPISQVRRTAMERIDRLVASGRTNLLPALDEARRSLDRREAGRKHVIVLTDGKLPGVGSYFIEMVKQMRVSGITVSTIMLGTEVDDGLLKSMAQHGGGRFYHTTDASALPKIFLKDVNITTGERTLKEISEYAVRLGPAGTKSTKLQSFPPVKGYVQTRPKARADLELVAHAEGKAEPLLASWLYGKGKSIAYTSDVSGRWSSYWVGWRSFDNFWSNIVDAARPKNSDSERPIRFDLRHAYQNGKLLLDLSVFEEITGAAGGEVLLPNGTKQQLSLTAQAPGRAIGEVAEPTPGRYELRLRVGARELTPVAFHLSGELFGEQRGHGFNRDFLEDLAAKTGGKTNPSVNDILHNAREVREEYDPSRWLLILGLVALLSEILYREVRNKG